MEPKITKVTVATADPSGIGLFGLAMVTLVASSQKLGMTDGTSLVLPWAIFLGALAQLYASVQDSKLNNVFGMTAFAAYGFFWLGIATNWLTQYGVLGEELQAAADPRQLGMAYLGYLIFTLFMTVGAMETHKVLFSIFFFIDLLFIGLTLSTFGIAHGLTHALAGWSELAIALLSFYGSAASVLNAHFGQVVLPVGKPFGIFKKHAA